MVAEKRSSREPNSSQLTPSIRKRATSQAHAAVRNLVATVRAPLNATQSNRDKENSNEQLNSSQNALNMRANVDDQTILVIKEIHSCFVCFLVRSYDNILV